MKHCRWLVSCGETQFGNQAVQDSRLPHGRRAARHQLGDRVTGQREFLPLVMQLKKGIYLEFLPMHGGYFKTFKKTLVKYT